METQSVVFYCKDCGGMFYACLDEPLLIADEAKAIKLYNKQGHKMAKVSKDIVRNNFTGCVCKK